MIKVHDIHVWKYHNESPQFVQLIHVNKNNLKMFILKQLSSLWLNQQFRVLFVAPSSHESGSLLCA
jgi:hypothetical protein